MIDVVDLCMCVVDLFVAPLNATPMTTTRAESAKLVPVRVNPSEL